MVHNSAAGNSPVVFFAGFGHVANRVIFALSNLK